ncbi:MAG: hypothetical protein MZV49_26160 [Rhodopseudomonas palustris]|nr:hypothetical protein [Rhodopseudomonas palustris]
MNGMPTVPASVAAAEVFNKVRRETRIRISPWRLVPCSAPCVALVLLADTLASCRIQVTTIPRRCGQALCCSVTPPLAAGCDA